MVTEDGWAVEGVQLADCCYYRVTYRGQLVAPPGHSGVRRWWLGFTRPEQVAAVMGAAYAHLHPE